MRIITPVGQLKSTATSKGFQYTEPCKPHGQVWDLGTLWQALEFLEARHPNVILVDDRDTGGYLVISRSSTVGVIEERTQQRRT